MTGVRPYTILGHNLDIEDWPGHVGASIVAAELNGGGYGLTGLGLKPGDTVVDVGANVGLVAMAVSRLYPGVRVIAMEPHPVTFGMLSRNLIRNGVQGVEPYRLGVSGDGLTVTLASADQSTGASSWLAEPVPPGHDAVSVETLTLADVFGRFGVDHCAWLKVDCEGDEHPALMGCPPGFFAAVDRLSVEAHKSPRLAASGFTAARLMAHLDRAGVWYEWSETRI